MISAMTRTRRITVPVLSAVVLLLALTACDPAGGGPSDSPDASSPSPSASETSDSTPPPPPPPPVTAAACDREDLKGNYAATDNSAGHLHGVLTVSNVSTETCSLSGYPTIYLLYPEIAATIGAASANDPLDPGVPFDLEPAARASANITIVQAGNVGDCELIDTTAFAYSPPGHAFDIETTAQRVEWGVVAGCNNDDIALVTVGGFAAD